MKIYMKSDPYSLIEPAIYAYFDTETKEFIIIGEEETNNRNEINEKLSRILNKYGSQAVKSDNYYYTKGKKFYIRMSCNEKDEAGRDQIISAVGEIDTEENIPFIREAFDKMAKQLNYTFADPSYLDSAIEEIKNRIEKKSIQIKELAIAVTGTLIILGLIYLLVKK